MRKSFFLLVVIFLTNQIQAQTNVTLMRLAILPETENARAIADVLTSDFTEKNQLQLVERADIEKIYREQGLSGADKDYLKLGQILGADGVLLLRSGIQETKQSLSVQLVAVKPGVVLWAESFLWPVTNFTEWSSGLVKQLAADLPKLSILKQDVVPISVVNFHAGVRTAAAAELEQQIFLLTVERLAREKRLFVLERKRMQVLAAEKGLVNDTVEAFWNGKYLLDGAIDPDGYSPETVTINARLVPPSGSPVSLRVSGSRTNYTEVVNELTEKVLVALRIDPTVTGWNALAEADRFFQEAKWNLSWGLLPQAQAAAESAWALGKQDPEGAKTRMKAYLPEAGPDPGAFDTGNACGAGDILTYISRDVLASKPLAAVFKRHPAIVYYAATHNQPDPQTIARAKHLLSLYDDCILRFAAVDEIKPDSETYALGINALFAAAKVLQHFHFVPASQPPVANELGELRALARKVAAKIEQSPAIHAPYFLDRQLTSADQAHADFSFGEYRDIFSCELQWGVFWQETPDDCIAMYQRLMASPNFSSIHTHFWLRSLMNPPVTAWSEENRSRVLTVWKSFVADLNSNSNVRFQLEGRSLVLADAETDEAATNAFNNLKQTIYSNLDLLATNAAMSSCLNWQIEELIFSLEAQGGPTGQGSHVITPVGESMRQVLKSEFPKKIAAAKQVVQNQRAAAEKQSAFDAQIKFLKENTPYDPQVFVNMFMIGFKEYSREQAQKIKPLLAEYKKNLSVAQARIGEMQVRQIEENIERILNPVNPTASIQANRTAFNNPPAAPLPSGNSQPTRPPWLQSPGPSSNFVRPGSSPNGPPEAPAESEVPAPDSLVASNIITERDFYPLPLDALPDEDTSEFIFTGQQLVEGLLVLDFEVMSMYAFKPSYAGAALFDPATRHWQIAVIPEPLVRETRNVFSHHSTIWRGALYSSNNGRVHKLNLQKNDWETNTLSMLGNCQLYNLDGKLYAADYNTIQEITDDGRSTKLLASLQRKPPLSSLDSQGALMNLALFTDAQKNLCAATHNKIFRWEGNDWHEIGAAATSFPPSVFPEGVIFPTDGFNLRPARISRFHTQSNSVELCLLPPAQKTELRGYQPRPTAASTNAKPLWKLPAELSLPNFSTALWQSDLFVMADHSEKQDLVAEEHSTGPDGKLETSHVITGATFISQQGYNASLFCFSRDLPAADKILLQFEVGAGCPPMSGKQPNPNFSMSGGGDNRAWMQFTTNLLLCGRSATPANFKPGIWAVPWGQIAAEVNALKELQSKTLKQAQAQAEQKEKAAQAKDQQARQMFFDKYDLNHNAVIDPEEQDPARDDPYFIKYWTEKIRAQKRNNSN